LLTDINLALREGFIDRVEGDRGGDLIEQMLAGASDGARTRDLRRDRPAL
jgi:hypothetical protein